MEQMPTPHAELPEKIIVESVNLKTNAEGKQYEVEAGGVYYGGDYLSKPPEEIILVPDFPVAPPEESSAAL